MFKILADTCVWENLAKDPQQRPLLNVIFELESSGDLGLIVPRIVLEEFERSKVRITKENTRSVSSTLKQRCGTGGTVKDGRIEIQGDQRERIVAELERLGYKVKRVGG